jgi:TonB dependent receptor
MKCMKVVLGSVMLALAPLAALADDMSYSSLDLAYVDTDIDDVNQSADGFALRGSIGFAENWFAFAEYATQSVQDVDIDNIAVGFGGHYGLTDTLDLVGRLGYIQIDLSVPGPLDADDDGYLADLGLRGRIGDSVELEGGLRYTDFSDGGDDTAFVVGGRFHFNKTWAVGAEYQSASDSSSILALVRASF